VRVAAVQPDLPRAAHRDTTAAGAQVVVWPEMALAFDPQVEHTAQLTALTAETQAHIVIGYVVENEEGFRNEAAVLAPGGQFLGVYGKSHPMITSGEPRTTTAGTYPVYHTRVGRMATMICFDALH